MDAEHEAGVDRGGLAPAALAWFGGALLALVASGAELACSSSRARETRPIAVWVADRDGRALVGLDRELYPQRHLSLDEWPTAAVPAPDGGVWVALARAGPHAAHRLLRVFADGRRGPESPPFEPLASPRPVVAVPDGRGGVLVWSGQRTLELLRVDAHGRTERVGGPWPVPTSSVTTAPGAGSALGTLPVSMAGSAGPAGGWLVGDSAGGLWMLSQEARLLGHSPSRGSPVVEVAGRVGGGWWVLLEDGRLLGLGAALELEWERATGISGARLALPDRDRAWVAGSGRSLCVGSTGTPLGRAPPLAGYDLEAGCGWGAGALFAAQGALVHVDESGALAPGQGGFEYIAALARAGPR